MKPPVLKSLEDVIEIAFFGHVVAVVAENGGVTPGFGDAMGEFLQVRSACDSGK